MRKLLVLAACLGFGVAHATSVSKLAFTLELPDGWVEVPSDTLQQLYVEMKRRAPGEETSKYDYAFQSNAGPPWLTYPYVLVKVRASGRASEQELEDLPAVAAKEGAPGPMRHDKATNIVWMSSQTQVATVGKVDGLTAFIPTERGFVDVHAYAPEADYPRFEPVFEKLIASVVIAPELKYQARRADDPGTAAGPGTKFLGVALAIGALIGIFWVISRRRKT